MTDLKSPEHQVIRHFLVVEDSRGKRLVPLEAASYALGRDSRSSIILHSKSVSRQHALLLRVTLDSGQHLFRILDGNLRGKRSTNGIFVNGERCTVHDLRHGDFIEFGAVAVNATYHTLTNLSDEEYRILCEADDPLFLLQEVSDDPATVIASPLSSPESSEAALMRLASFPELMHQPIIELEPEGQISYINPAGIKQFPDLRQQGHHHPILAGLLPISETLLFSRRTVEYRDLFFDQSIHYLPTNELIRIVMTDITAQKLAEVELNKRDRLISAVSDSSALLLRETDNERAIEQSLRLLGEAAAVDRVCVYENHPHPLRGELCMSLRQEWVAPGILALKNQPFSQNQSYSALYLEPWFDQLEEGSAIVSLRGQDVHQDQGFFDPCRVQSLLIMPIFNGFALWGHISFHDCQSLRQWSSQEELGLRMLATNLGAVLQRQQAEDLNHHRATHDALTGLLNRSAFDQALLEALKIAQRTQQTLAILFLDLDRFKEINDRWGHSLGDQLLRATAHRLQALFAAPNLIARWG
jgi:pSer/pThr/pTyr-binding forkhead associated (FHA) protein/GAF domain-containing protein